MKTTVSLVGLVIAMAIIWFVIKSQFSSQGPTGGQPPVETIDIAGVRNELLAIAQAERMYLASHGSYAQLDSLQQDGMVTFSGPTHRGYNYTADVEDGEHFRITAVPSDPGKATWPTLTIDETMQVRQQ